MAQINLPQMPHFVGWETFTRSHISIFRMFLFYAVPMSLVPPAMIHYAGLQYGGHLLPALTSMQLLVIDVVFFITELVMTFLVASVIQRLCAYVDAQPTAEEAYKLAVVIPTPLWLAPLFLFIPSFILNLTIAGLAAVASCVLIYYAVPSILKIKEENAFMLSSSILGVGMVAWMLMLFLTLLTWNFVGYWMFT